MKIRVGHKIGSLMALFLCGAVLVTMVIWFFQKKIDNSIQVTDKVNLTAQTILDARIAEKSYMQLYDMSFSARLKEKCETALT
ncbi:MAG: hypothetical protein SV375_22285, partial [Thermodesulfobacteriota bacterium]|nr:hypothetical protein [Thermodesulfobacteriota bacterium]